MELTYIQPDHLGTPRVVIDPVRDVLIWELSSKSEVFGNHAPANDPDGDGVGQQATAARGLFYNYQREYDPAVGRYSQSDPIGLRGGISTFAYAAGGPVSGVDPLGLQRSAVRYFPNEATASPGGDGYLVHQSGYDYGPSASEIPIFPGPNLLGDALMVSALVSTSPAIWRELLGQFSQGQSDCPIPGTTPDGTTKGHTRIEKKPGDFGTANGYFDTQRLRGTRSSWEGPWVDFVPSRDHLQSIDLAHSTIPE
ncbi:RHS repeat-associated core domain-containing protein [Stenotrophomonas sp. S41]|uniref:RHS repeat-associated core domain-containing protein n=1 Tax=Stenotrophomonas sp. S41 TaxID=2767464 RepID=UPI002D7E501D|nr:RHS repeat-associated core domain-containing protein [Stenotrophomonas sp. S41]